MPDDYSADRFTTGTVAVGDTATGNIGSNGDGDWFAVELVAGRTYVIDLRGSPTDDGTLSDPYLRGVYDADGNLIPRTTNDDGGEGYNSRVTCQWRSKKGPPWRCKKGPLGGCGLVPVVHGRAPRATRRALNRLTRRRAREGPVGPRGQAWAGWSVQLAVGV